MKIQQDTLEHSVQELTTVITKAVKLFWPDLSIPVNIHPLLSADQGDLCSDVPLLLASQTGKTPQSIARKIISNISCDKKGIFLEERGYLNYRFSAEQLSAFRPGAHFSGGPEVVYLVSGECPSVSEDPLLRFRMLSCISLQYRLLLNSGKIPKVLNIRDGIEGFFEGTEKDILGSFDFFSGTEEENIESYFEKILKEKQKVFFTYWVVPGKIKNSRIRKFLHEYTVKHRILSLRVLQAQKNAADWNSEILHTGFYQEYFPQIALYGSELCHLKVFDPEVPKSQEATNLLWFLRSIRNRIIQLRGQEELSGSPGKKLKISESFLSLYRLGVLLPFFAFEGALLGRLSEFFQALREFLQLVMRTLNTPDFRIRASQGSLSPEERNLVSDIENVLSVMEGYLRSQ